MEFIEQIKSAIPDYAKDIRLNVDAVLQRSALEPTEAIGAALAAAYAAKSTTILRALQASGIGANEVNAAKYEAAVEKISTQDDTLKLAKQRVASKKKALDIASDDLALDA